ncbi:hypothetical protein JCM11491_005880 [Sporobolomyces phaffii]
MTTLPLPYIVLQPSTSQVLSDVGTAATDVAVEDVWISFYRTTPDPDGPQHESLHGRARISETDHPGEVEVRVQKGDFVVEQDSDRNVLRASCKPLSIPPTDLVLPSRKSNVTPISRKNASSSEEVPAPSFYSPSNGKDGVECFAISNDRRRIVVGSRDGQCKVVEIVEVEENGLQKRTKGKEVALRGHVGDITSVQFFPSNEVVLTASSDMSLRVFSTIDGSCPRHLQGHTKRVTGTHILVEGEQHKGREILSSSQDGTIRLWDLATGQEMRRWTLAHPISTLLVISPGRSIPNANVLEGKFAICGHPNGSSSLISLTAASTANSAPSLITQALATFRSSVDASSVETLAFDRGTRLLAVGSRSGLVSLFPLPSCPLAQIPNTEIDAVRTWKRTEGSSVNQVCWSERDGHLSLLVAGSDGLPYRASIEHEEGSNAVHVRVLEEFVGLNCDSCSAISETEDAVWTSGGLGDGSIRVYDRTRRGRISAT